MTGEIFDIKHFAVHDGPGIRTTIFLKGCPLRCVWCHNPEGMRPGKDLWVKHEACIHCRTCVGVCPEKAVYQGEDGKIHIRKDQCTFCGRCVQACPSRAMRRIDRQMDTEEIVDLVKREQLFSDVSGGGVTVSGGEPMFQPRFTEELLKRMQGEGIRTCIETSMYASSDTVRRVTAHLDEIIMDIKLIDDSQHRKYTGVSNRQILENFRYAASLGKPLLVRTPLIPGITATKENLQGIRAFIDTVNPEIPMEILNYNYMAGSKYALLDRTYYNDDQKAFSEEEMRVFRGYTERRKP